MKLENNLNCVPYVGISNYLYKICSCSVFHIYQIYQKFNFIKYISVYRCLSKINYIKAICFPKNHVLTFILWKLFLSRSKSHTYFKYIRAKLKQSVLRGCLNLDRVKKDCDNVNKAGSEPVPIILYLQYIR